MHYVWVIVLVSSALLVFGGYNLSAFFKKHDVKTQDLLSFFGSPKSVLESTNNRTNFLLLGIRGEGSDSPNLSDTIMIASYNHNTNESTLISIPRDLWVPSIQAKINTAYYYGEKEGEGDGIKMASGSILETTGLPIHYTAVVNFSLFRQIVDLVGGIDINITKGFVDKEFPILGKENAMPISERYETVSFPVGSMHMDGETSLKYIRSRHSEGEEGTDFARSRRQQEVFDALRQKVFTASFLLDKSKVEKLVKIVTLNIKSNVSEGLYPTLAKLALDMHNSSFNRITLSNTPDKNGVSILYNPPASRYKGAWVLIPQDGNWNAFKQYINNLLEGKQ